LYIKCIQTAAESLKIPYEKVIIAETGTTTVANSTATAGSMGTDLYCMATLDACEQIKKRLKPYYEKYPNAEWAELVSKAYFDRCDLSAHGFYIVPEGRCGYDWSIADYKARGMPFNYFTQGVAVTEVEIDVLTGDNRVLRADILMDLGKSINPAVDIGQIEGAFVQGYGWSCLEELIWGDNEHKWVRTGQLFTKGPGFYKLPSFNDVPLDFRVHLADTNNRFAVHSSKAVGEPPFFLGCAPFFAIRDAIMAARRDHGLTDYYRLDLPATSERIRMACGDNIAKLCTGNNEQFVAKGSY